MSVLERMMRRIGYVKIATEPRKPRCPVEKVERAGLDEMDRAVRRWAKAFEPNKSIRSWSVNKANRIVRVNFTDGSRADAKPMDYLG